MTTSEILLQKLIVSTRDFLAHLLCMQAENRTGSGPVEEEIEGLERRMIEAQVCLSQINYLAGRLHIREGSER